MNRKVVVSAGHLIQRKGILDFLKLAKMMPETTFIWFGGGNDSLVTQEVKEAVKKKSENVSLPDMWKQKNFGTPTAEPTHLHSSAMKRRKG